MDKLKRALNTLKIYGSVNLSKNIDFFKKLKKEANNFSSFKFLVPSLIFSYSKSLKVSKLF
jgi:hypothetical protein